jgi:hypothetical protein
VGIIKPRSIRGAATIVVGLVVTAAGGCGGPAKAKVHGIVTFDGKPIKSGTIEFFPLDGKGQSAGTSITDGAYTVEAGVGEMRVTVNAMEVYGKHKAYDTPDSPMIEDVRNPIPAKYNTKSELKQMLKAGDNEVNLDLTSGKAEKK